MSEKRRGLGRGLGALIPPTPSAPGSARPTDVFFAEKKAGAAPERFTGNNAGRDQSAEGFTGNIDSTVDEAAPTEAPEGRATGGDGTEDLKAVPGARFAELLVARIRPNPRQPRQVFDEDDMAELVHSISEIGVLQPVVVREVTPEDSSEIQFELIMGERRLRATAKAGLERIPAIVRTTNDDDLLRDALLENLHRAQLNPLEEAAAYQQLLEDFGCTHEELARRIGRSRPQITNTVRLLKLPPLVARRVAAGVLSAGHARALLALPDGASMERIAQRIVAEGLSVRTTEEIVSLGDDRAPARRNAPRQGARHPQLDDLAASLSDRLDTRVAINLGKRKGKLTVEFASVEDLQRIIDMLGLQTD
ncbi:ParB/RepB/Spo0J family partition protein [Leekyejoonella antrihumi]|uniref:ParB/RepB/Spo0J family partition protein n=1 Tax=Leekyejoonella antrihumi TaxID=1660198 RepID=A0A563E7I0_9MICO|nr:ParB/RepB/Spo0J family partition protein [Leekyejoonella antrihumi]TWP38259.1 ParB/RepB/Spo0J family partition protein [Leekyejoonella antrihumi]